MALSRRFKRRLKRIFSPYNLIIVLCVAAVAVGVYIFFKPANEVKFGDITIVQTNTKEGEEISEKDAKKTAVKQFDKLGEKVKDTDLTIQKIQRKGELYYYITSQNNTMEIKIVGGKVTRINSVLVNG